MMFVERGGRGERVREEIEGREKGERKRGERKGRERESVVDVC